MFGAWVNAAGLPSISVPGQPHPDGRPIGVQIVAPFGHDAVVLEIAQRLEILAPWAERWPAMALTAPVSLRRDAISDAGAGLRPDWRLLDFDSNAVTGGERCRSAQENEPAPSSEWPLA